VRPRREGWEWLVRNLRPVKVVYRVMSLRVWCRLTWVVRDTYIHIYTYIQVIYNAHNVKTKWLNLRRGRSLGGKRTVTVNDEQTDGFLDGI